MAWRHPRNSFPSHSDRTCAATRRRHTHKRRESRGSAGSPRRRRAARRARAARAAASPGGGWGARGRAKGARGEGRAEFDSRRAYGMLSRNPCTSAAIIPPPLPASRLEGGSTSAGIGARRAHSIEVHTWDRGALPRLSIKPPTIPVMITCANERVCESASRARHAGEPHAGRGPHGAAAAARASLGGWGRGGEGQLLGSNPGVARIQEF